MDPNDSRLTQMIATAREYCELIENMDTTDCAACMSAMSRLLPRLERSAEALPESSELTVEPVHTSTPDYEARFDLFSRIHTALGKIDSYHLEFDHPERADDNSGSLADDFTDIYFDLRYGLDLLDTHPEDPSLAVASWKTSYDLHWREHLRGARPQLTNILATVERH